MKQPEVKRDRVGVLASTIVKELASARVESIRREDVETVEPPIVVTSYLATRLKEYALAKKAGKRAEAAIEKAGFRVTGDSEDGYTIARPYQRHDERKAMKIRAKDERINRVRQMRTEALINLVELDSKKVKESVRAFRVAIESV